MHIPSYDLSPCSQVHPHIGLTGAATIEKCPRKQEKNIYRYTAIIPPQKSLHPVWSSVTLICTPIRQAKTNLAQGLGIWYQEKDGGGGGGGHRKVGVFILL